MKIITDVQVKGVEVELSEAAVIAKMIHEILGRRSAFAVSCYEVVDNKKIIYNVADEYYEHEYKFVTVTDNPTLVKKFLLLAQLYQVVTGEKYIQYRHITLREFQSRRYS